MQEALEHQKDKLELLETAEREARRLDDALERGGMGRSVHGEAAEGGGGSEREGLVPERERLERVESPPRRVAGGSFGLLNAVKHSLSGMIDVDPEATRRANIGKTRDNISQVGSSAV